MPAFDFQPHPLFYDALSGEFAPKCDPEERKHTLARLAYAASIKGELLEEESDSFYEYAPSWAPDRFWVVLYNRHDEFVLYDDPKPVIEGKSSWLALMRRTTDNGKPHLVLRSDGSNGSLETVHPLELGPKLNEIREEIATTAQEFFDRMHPSAHE